MTEATISRRRLLLERVGVFVTVFLPMVVAIHQFALGWDEGFTFDRQEALKPWLHRLFSSGPSEGERLLAPGELDRHWRFSKEEPDGHGPFYCLLSMASHALTGELLSPPASHRVGSIALFALAMTCVFATFRRRWGLTAALATVVLLASLPRVLPEVCYALIDGPLFSLALLAFCAFVRSMEADASWGPVLFGLALGLAMASKLTGWLLLGPYIAWSVIYPTWRHWRSILIGSVVSLLVVFTINVGWWPDPLGGLQRFFHSNLSRDQTIPIPTLFLGTIYPFSLPWYNTLVWTVVAAPVGTLLLGISGIGVAIASWRRDPLGILLVFNWALLVVVRALPQAPGHDGTRQIIISFGFLALLAGYALHELLAWAKRHQQRAVSALAVFVAVVAASESLYAVVRYHPMQLSYYSPLIGGLRGAERMGFEPTYFWDSLTGETLDWLNQHTAPGRSVTFCNYPHSFDYLARWGYFRARFKPPFAPETQWYVLQHRPGIYKPVERVLLATAEPAYVKALDSVRLLSVFSIDDWVAAQHRLNAKEDTGSSPRGDRE